MSFSTHVKLRLDAAAVFDLGDKKKKRLLNTRSSKKILRNYNNLHISGRSHTTIVLSVFCTTPALFPLRLQSAGLSFARGRQTPKKKPRLSPTCIIP